MPRQNCRKSQQHWGGLVQSWSEIVERQNKETSKTICGEKKQRDASIRGRGRAHRTRWFAFRHTLTTTATWSWSCRKASEANNKKLDKERQEAEEIWWLAMEHLSETQKRRSNNDDDFDVISPKQKKSRSSGTDTIA